MELILRMELRIQSISVGLLAKDKIGTDAKLGAWMDGWMSLASADLG